MKKSKRIALLALLLALTVILSLIPIRVSSATLALTLLPVLVLALTQDFFTGLLGGLVMGVTSLVMAFSVGAASPTAPIFQNPLVSIVPRLFVPAVAFAVMKALGAMTKRIYFRHRRLPAAENVSDGVLNDIPAEGATQTADAVFDTEISEDVDDGASCGVVRVKTADSDEVTHTVADSPDDKDETQVADGISAPRAAKSKDKTAENAADELPKVLQAFVDGAACLAGVLTNTGLVLGMMWALYGGKSVGDTLISPEFMTAMISINFVIEVILFPLVTPPVVYAVRKSARKRS